MIKRTLYLDKIRPFIDKKIIKVLTGVRRSGKSILLEQIKDELLNLNVSEEQIILINFEKIEFEHLLDYHALHNYIVEEYKRINKRIYILLDEIQNVNSWELAVNSLNVSIDSDIYITGSNAKVLSSELSTHLSGRYIEFTIYPLSFKEYNDVFLSFNSNKSREESFRSYVKLGGMPFLSNLDFDYSLSQVYLNDVFNTIVLKDIVERNKVREPALLDKIIRYLINSMGNSFSATSISKYFKNLNIKVSTETILNYIKYCLDAYLLMEADNEDVLGKEALGGNSKYYLVDHSFKELLFSNNEKDINLVLENIVYVELKRRGYKVSVGHNKTKEIDFVCQKPNEKFYIQVSYLLASDETIEREFGAYKGINDNYPKYVLSLDPFDMSRNGIKHKNIIDFLLEV